MDQMRSLKGLLSTCKKLLVLPCSNHRINSMALVMCTVADVYHKIATINVLAVTTPVSQAYYLRINSLY
jgi:hypothetical protein